MPKLPKDSVCAYCGQPATSMDHIPAQNLLVGVPRSKRPWVPSCTACNAGASKDDEYFRDVLLLRKKAAEVPAARPARGALLRGIRMPKKRAYLAAITRSMRDVRYGKDGAIEEALFAPDEARVERTLRRYVHGLHVRLLGAIPAGHDIFTYANVEAVTTILEKVPDLLDWGEVHVVQHDTFTFRVWSSPPIFSHWTLTFFDTFPMLGFVGPAGDG